MPEIVEVEVVKNQLQDLMQGKTIKSLKILKPLPRQKNLEDLSLIEGKKIVSFFRFAKKMYIKLSNGKYLYTHLGMTGGWFPYDRLTEEQKKSKHIRYIIELTDEEKIYYIDPRGFGALQLLDENKNEHDLDLLSPNFSFFELKIWDSKKSIYHFLHKQEIFPGMGAYLGCEMLFLAKVHPLTKCSSLTKKDIKEMEEGIKTVLKLAFKENGASFSDYLNPSGEKGGMQKLFKVYNRAGEVCFRCHQGIIEKLEGKRGSHFCPVCQIEK